MSTTTNVSHAVIESNEPRQRDLRVDFAKGGTMLLVLLGHYGSNTFWPDYWVKIVAVIYLFHMPLFMAISGYLAGRSFQKQFAPGSLSLSDHWAFVRRRWVRLLVPYVFVEFVYVAIKGVGQVFFSHHPPDLTSLANIVIMPEKAPAAVLWFIFTLAAITTIFPLFEILLRNRVLVLLVTAALALLPINAVDRNYFQYADIARLLFFYVLGVTYAESKTRNEPFHAIRFAVSLALFAIGAVWYGRYGTVPPVQVDVMATRWFCAAMGIVASVELTKWVCRTTAVPSKPVKLFSAIGEQSSVIYFFHVPLVWLPAIVLHEKLHLTGLAFLAGLPVGVALGLTIPVLICGWLTRSSRWCAFALSGDPKKLSLPQPG